MLVNLEHIAKVPICISVSCIFTTKRACYADVLKSVSKARLNPFSIPGSSRNTVRAESFDCLLARLMLHVDGFGFACFEVHLPFGYVGGDDSVTFSYLSVVDKCAI